MSITAQDIIDYVASWRGSNGIPADASLSEAQKAQFARDLQAKIEEMPVLYEHQSNATMIQYSGQLDGRVFAYKVAEKLSGESHGANFYISDTPRGQLLNNQFLPPKL